MKFLFWASALWLAYVYVGYAVALAALAHWRPVRYRRQTGQLPSVSVLIAARNEAKDIGWKVCETLAWDYPEDKLEVLVASDASDDATDSIVRRAAGADARVRLTRMARRGGKNRALNRLADAAAGEVLFFTDANAHVEAGTLRRMIRHFEDPRVGCVTGDSRSIESGAVHAVASGTGAYFSYEGGIKGLESALGSVLVCDGAIFAIRRALFTSLDPELANDLELPMRIGERGYLVTQEPSALVRERDTSSAREEFDRRRRIVAQGMLGMLRLSSAWHGLRGWQFVSHKFLRWLSLLPLVSMLAASVLLAPASVFFAVMLAGQAAFWVLAAVGACFTMSGLPVGRWTGIPFFVTLGLAGALTGVTETLLGRRFDIWEIPAMSRGQVQER